jgi:WD40 repeat protein
LLAALVTASDDNTARVWDAGSGKELARLVHEDMATE